MGLYKEITACCDICNNLLQLSDEDSSFEEHFSTAKETKKDILKQLNKYKWSVKDNKIICNDHINKITKVQEVDYAFWKTLKERT